MKAQDLRIDNYLEFKGKIIQVDWIDKYDHIGHDNKSNPIKMYKPITITKELLLKFGLENSNPILMYNSDGDAVYLSDFEHIKFVHQLQNLVFAIESRELTLTP
jgi:hypothetical protein